MTARKLEPLAGRLEALSDGVGEGRDWLNDFEQGKEYAYSAAADISAVYDERIRLVTAAFDAACAAAACTCGLPDCEALADWWERRAEVQAHIAEHGR